MSIHFLSAQLATEKAFRGVQPSRKPEIICDITKALISKAKSSSHDAVYQQPGNITFFNRPRDFVKLEKSQHQLKVATIALAVTAAALFIFGVLSILLVLAPISPVILGGVLTTAFLASPVLFISSFGTGMAHLAKNAQYRKEINKVVDFIRFRQPEIENKVKPVYTNLVKQIA